MPDEIRIKGAAPPVPAPAVPPVILETHEDEPLPPEPLVPEKLP